MPLLFLLGGCNLTGSRTIRVDAYNVDKSMGSEEGISIELFFSKNPYISNETRAKLTHGKTPPSKQKLPLRGHYIYRVQAGDEVTDILTIPDSVRRVFCMLKSGSKVVHVKDALVNPYFHQLTITLIGRDFAITYK